MKYKRSLELRKLMADTREAANNVSCLSLNFRHLTETKQESVKMIGVGMFKLTRDAYCAIDDLHGAVRKLEKQLREQSK